MIAICRNTDTGEIVSFVGNFKTDEDVKKLINPCFLRVLEIVKNIDESKYLNIKEK